MKPLKPHILLVGNYGSGNLGDEALCHYYILSLAQDYQITIVSRNPAISRIFYRQHTISRNDIWSLYRYLDRDSTLLFGGGGLLQDETSLRSLLYYLTLIILAKYKRAQVQLLSQGLGPLRRRFSRWLVPQVLNRVDYLSVRDHRSYELCKDWQLNVNIERDPVLDLPYNLEQEVKLPGSIGISVRPWKTLNKHRLDEIIGFIEELAKTPDNQIHLLVFDNSMDLNLCCQIKKALLHYDNVLLYTTDSPNDMMQMVGQMEMIIGMRLHACIMAARMAIPFFGISYDPKVEAFCRAEKKPFLTIEQLTQKTLRQLYKSISGKL